MPSILKCLCALLAAAVSVSAAPMVSAESMTYSGGTVKENSVVKAVFRLTNTGDEPLRLTQVRPGCGCTVVSYDSVIAPGKTGLIKPEVNLKGMRAGHMSRGVTVISNAANTPMLQLTIEATIVQAVEISETYMIFNGPKPKAVTLISPKKDLKVAAVVFTPHSGGNTPAWAVNAPLNLTHKLTPGRARDGELWEYTLEITPPAVKDEVIEGSVHINTNHPEKKEVVITGRIE
ncbi:MAG: DUF1573 domain-containing protein [Chitinispirillia bacterium]|nr:DUF1573 domain-containing protein [Chitinispirillia bacterium]MCL2242662.1 DUF1573 domain-containing protein [Chitinispirillia bacterium]